MEFNEAFNAADEMELLTGQPFLETYQYLAAQKEHQHAVLAPLILMAAQPYSSML